DTKTGAIRWVTYFPKIDTMRNTALPGGATLSGNLVIGAPEDGAVRALNRADGTLAWVSEPLANGAYFADMRGVISCGALAIATSAQDHLTAHDVRSGKVVWSIQTGRGTVDWHPYCDDRFIYIIDGSSDL